MEKCHWCSNYFSEGGFWGYMSEKSGDTIYYHNRLFCSQKCFYEMLNTTGFKEGKWVWCKYCGEFYRESNSTYKYDSNDFCSESCVNSYQSYLRDKSEQEEQKRIVEIRERERKREKWERENPELAKQEKEKRRKEEELRRERLRKEEEAHAEIEKKKFKRYKNIKNLWFLWLMPISVFVLLLYVYFDDLRIIINPLIDKIILYAKNSEEYNKPFVIYPVIITTIVFSSLGMVFSNINFLSIEKKQRKLSVEKFLIYCAMLLLTPIFFFVNNWLWEVIAVFLYTFVGGGSILILYEGGFDDDLEELGIYTAICFSSLILRTILFIAYIIMYLFSDKLPALWLKGTLDIFLVFALSLLPLYIIFKMRTINKFFYLFTIGVLLNIALILIFF
ncbi:MAG: hypothetical protein RBT74_14875 [Tenuifilaceae bacterium]|jgi:hypothetical protein|nr:hypothetical protein [Tenuifilaceae bacterium]